MIYEKTRQKKARQPLKDTEVLLTETDAQIRRYRDELDFLEWWG